MNEQKQQVSVGLRFVSMFVDHFAMTLIMVLIVLPGFAISLFQSFNIDHELVQTNSGLLFFLFVLGFCAYFNKDIFNGRSPAKRILKLQVLNAKTNEVASPWKYLLRNLTLFIWPIEIIFILINPKSRLGDKIAGTKIEFAEPVNIKKTNKKKLAVPILVALGFSFLISLPILILSNQDKWEAVKYVETSYNTEKGLELQQIVNQELDQIVEQSDFKYYEQIEDDNKHYLSAIVYLKNKADFDNTANVEEKLLAVLHKQLPQNENIYFIKYVYSKSGTVGQTQKYYGRNSEVE